jgi:hypothetical protein
MTQETADQFFLRPQAPGRPVASRANTLPITEAARLEASLSGLPGYNDGPADALRHLIGAAELRRRFGWSFAFAATTANEIEGQEKGQAFASDWMDMENNWIGMRIGAQARTFADVVNLAQRAIADAIPAGGKDRRGAVWRDREFWSDGRSALPETLLRWRPSGPQSRDYAFGAESFRLEGRQMTPREAEEALMARLTKTPVADCTYDDVRAVIRSRPYSSGSDRFRPVWQAKVREWFQQREAERSHQERRGARAGTDDSCGGTVDVSAHTRQTRDGPVQVSAHTRTVVCG